MSWQLVADLKEQISELQSEIERLKAAHDHQYAVSGTLLREAERLGSENDELRAEIRKLTEV